MVYFFFFRWFIEINKSLFKVEKKCQKTRGQQLTKEGIKKKNTKLTKARGNKDNYYKFYANIIL